eukprot:GILJ01002970.1.p1 GENE.GILJ01002970.1~~GILJ01002970.1.p1  ORF type:complete len:261 (+),score=35.72 GILJ01002970.1:47-784(+)
MEAQKAPVQTDEHETHSDKNEEETEEEFESRLTKKSYWDSVYEQDIENFDDHGEIGEIWFGKKAVQNMVSWIRNCLEILPSDPVVDIGCGNGFFLISLHKAGYTRLCGIDYSEPAIDLAKKIAENEGAGHIKLIVDDVLRPSPLEQYKVVADKGTYDPISLMKPDAMLPYEGAAPLALYKQTVLKLLRDDGYFIITSCNHTQDELIRDFAPEFQCHDTIAYPVISFRGVQGSSVSSVIFKKTAQH